MQLDIVLSRHPVACASMPMSLTAQAAHTDGSIVITVLWNGNFARQYRRSISEQAHALETMKRDIRAGYLTNGSPVPLIDINWQECK